MSTIIVALLHLRVDKLAHHHHLVVFDGTFTIHFGVLVSIFSVRRLLLSADVGTHFALMCRVMLQSGPLDAII